jgi:hypothetical protein
MTAATVEHSSTASSVVRPRWATPRTPERPTFGHAVAAVSAALGRPFMPHQRYVVDVALEVQSEAAGDPEPGAWAYDQIGLTIQRRGGKTSVITPVAVHRAHHVPRASMWMTAQNRDKARKRWFDVTEDILLSVLKPDVTRKVSHMFEELRWKANGSLLVPFSPNDEAMHSETPHLVFVDELWAFDEETAQGIRAGYVPAFATTDGQAWLMSTAGTTKSAWLNEARTHGRAAVDTGVRLGTAWFEWGLPDTIGGVPVAKLDGEALVQACIDYHPAICHEPGCPGARGGKPCEHGYTARPAALRSAWVHMGQKAEEYLRAYGNRSADDRTEEWRELELATWLRSVDADGIPESTRVELGVWVDEDSADASVAAGWRDPHGVMHSETLAREPGTGWVASYVQGVVERQKPGVVAIPNVGANRDVADQLAKLGVPVLVVSQADVSAACVRHKAELAERKWKHRHHDEAMKAAAAVTRTTGKAWMWGKDGAPFSALGAQTMAGWGADHAPMQSGFWIR